MRLFLTRGADAAYDSWLDPPTLHEDCSCIACHEGHLDENEFYSFCDLCKELEGDE